MGSRVTFEIYGRFLVIAEQTRGGMWTFHRAGTDGKRELIADMAVAPDATLDEVQRMLEATYHEMARPGTSIVRIHHG